MRYPTRVYQSVHRRCIALGPESGLDRLIHISNGLARRPSCRRHLQHGVIGGQGPLSHFHSRDLDGLESGSGPRRAGHPPLPLPRMGEPLARSQGARVHREALLSRPDFHPVVMGPDVDRLPRSPWPREALLGLLPLPIAIPANLPKLTETHQPAVRRWPGLKLRPFLDQPVAGSFIGRPVDAHLGVGNHPRLRLTVEVGQVCKAGTRPQVPLDVFHAALYPPCGLGPIGMTESNRQAHALRQVQEPGIPDRFVVRRPVQDHDLRVVVQAPPLDLPKASKACKLIAGARLA